MTRLLPPRTSRVFDKYNPNWVDRDMRRNVIFIHMVEECANRMLRIRGYITLNEVYEMLGFKPTKAGGMIGWVRGPGTGWDHIDFGVWNEGIARGKAWIKGDIDAMRLYFNVDPTDEPISRRIKRLKKEGKI